MDYEIIRSAAKNNDRFTLITIINAKGSVPRKIGTAMFLSANGCTVGTIGGGAVESIAISKAVNCFNNGKSETLKIDMNGQNVLSEEQICGGFVEISIDQITCSDHFKFALNELEAGRRVIFSWIPGFTQPIVWCRTDNDLINSSNDNPSNEIIICNRIFDEGKSYLSDQKLWLTANPPDRLLILGGGYVGQALATMAVKVGFKITIGDPRPEYSKPMNFPVNSTVINGKFSDVIDNFVSGESAYAVVVSPDHLGDLECARILLDRNFKYIGLIGSRRKSKMFMDHLVSEGFDTEKLSKLHTPVGADIGAETPEEIAVSILAEMIAVKRNVPLPRRKGEKR